MERISAFLCSISIWWRDKAAPNALTWSSCSTCWREEARTCVSAPRGPLRQEWIQVRRHRQASPDYSPAHRRGCSLRSGTGRARGELLPPGWRGSLSKPSEREGNVLPQVTAGVTSLVTIACLPVRPPAGFGIGPTLAAGSRGCYGAPHPMSSLLAPSPSAGAAPTRPWFLSALLVLWAAFAAYCASGFPPAV